MATTVIGQDQVFDPQEEIEALVPGWIDPRGRQQRLAQAEPAGQRDGEEQLQQDGGDVGRDRDADECGGRRGLVEQRAGAHGRQDADAEADDEADGRGGNAEHDGVGHGVLQLGPHRAAALDRATPVERDEVMQPAEVLRDDVAGEAVGFLVLQDLGRRGPRVDPEVALHRIGADADRDEHQERDEEQRGNHPQESSNDEPDHRAAPPM